MRPRVVGVTPEPMRVHRGSFVATTAILHGVETQNWLNAS